MLFVVFTVCLSCEDIQDNSPALQAELNNDFFRSIGSTATINDDNSVTIQASNQDETLTLSINRSESGNFQLGGLSENFATFEDINGNVYSTIGVGEGVVTVSAIDPATTISGSFTFKAVLAGIDTLYAQRGVFFEVPFVSEAIEVPIEPDPQISVGTLLGRVDGNVFNSVTVTATVNNGTILIQGTKDDSTIELGIPLTAQPSSTILPDDEYFANYIVGATTEPALEGNVFVFTHNTTAKTIKGTFSFRSENHIISVGQFNVRY
jgi:hypothetical protein